MRRLIAISLVALAAVAARAGRPAAAAAAAAEHRAGDVPTYADLKTDETVTFVLRSGRKRRITLVAFDRTSADLTVDGKALSLTYRPYDEFTTVAGMRIAVDITRAWSDRKRWRAFGLAEGKDCRLFISDASGPVMSNPPGVYPLQPPPKLNNGRSGGWLHARRSSQKDCHVGYDTYGPMGTRIVAMEAGEVVRTADDPYQPAGRHVVIRGSRFVYTYIHLATLEVKAGQKVTAGQMLGYMGQSGWVRPHLHLQMSPVRPDGIRRDVNAQHCMRDIYRSLRAEPGIVFHRVDLKFVDAAGEPVRYAETWLKFPDGRLIPCDRTRSTAVTAGRYRLISTQKKLGLRGERDIDVKARKSVTVTMRPVDERFQDPAIEMPPPAGVRQEERQGERR